MPSFKFNNALTGIFILGIRVSVHLEMDHIFFHEGARGLSSFL